MEHVKFFEDFRSEKNRFSDFQGRELTIERNEDELLEFNFDSMGWIFDTNDIAEGVSIIKGSHYKDEPEIRNIIITEKDKKNVDPEQSLYWLTGGNETWRFGMDDNINVSWDDIADEVIDEFGDSIKKMVLDSNTLGELIDELLNFDISAVHEFMLEKGYINIEDEEED